MQNVRKGIVILIAVGGLCAYSLHISAKETTQPAASTTPGSATRAQTKQPMSSGETVRLAARFVARQNLMQKVTQTIAYLDSLQVALKSPAAGAIKIGVTNGKPNGNIIDASNPTVNANLLQKSQAVKEELGSLNTLLADGSLEPPKDQELQTIVSFKGSLDSTQTSSQLFTSLLRMKVEVTANTNRLKQQLQLQKQQKQQKSLQPKP
jgi:hypothetical protein